MIIKHCFLRTKAPNIPYNLHFLPMNKLNKLLLLAILSIFIFSSCQSDIQEEVVQEVAVQEKFIVPVADKKINRHGKNLSTKKVNKTYEKVELADLTIPTIDNNLMQSIKSQIKLLKYRRKRHKSNVGNLDVTIKKLQQTVDILLNSKVEDLAEELDAYQIKGKDNKGNVKFTGYFTPVLEVSKTKSAEYPYPLYTRPKNWEGKLPSRADIDGKGVLKDKGLELAYTKNLVDIYFMQIQGSGIVEYPDGTRKLFAHNGSNGHKYRSIGKYMINEGLATPAHVSLKSIKKFCDRNPDLMHQILFSNPSYIFFNEQDTSPKGAGMVPLLTDHSIAVDTKYIPMGSVLLAAVPVIDKNRKFSHHEYRLLVAQDIGGAIKGAGHIDLYSGTGEEGKWKASNLHHYGNLWLLLPKENKQPIASR